MSGADGGVAASTNDQCRWPEGERVVRPHWLAPGEVAPALLVAAVLAVTVRFGTGAVTLAALAVVGTAGVVIGRRSFVVGLVVLCAFGAWRAETAIDGLRPDRLGPYEGWAVVAADPSPVYGATRVVVAIEGERFELFERGRAAQLRVGRWRQGDQAWVAGERRALAPDRAQRVAWQHVVGAFSRETLGDVRAGRPLDVATNRVRGLIERGVAPVGVPYDSLARGLIIGDDREQPEAMTQRFRASGLSHLAAVSGQNVALVIAAAGPIVGRWRTGPRVVATLALIAWFVVLTRAEPSVLRAGVMAGVSTIAWATGREREPPRSLAIAVVVLLLIDPLLVRSIGFWLSVGATAGVTLLTRPFTAALAPLRRLALPLGVTLAAQAGVALPSLLVFGRLSVVGTVANLIAVPIAGAVMLYGLPAALAAGALGGVAPPVATVLMVPIGVGVRLIDRVADLAARLQPPPALNVAGWLVLGALVVAGALRRPSAASSEPPPDLPH